MAKPYSVSVRITEPRGNILWVRRSITAPKRAGEYEYPGGHVELGERAREAALREVREETGLKIPDYELRVLKRVTREKGDHIIYEYRAKKPFYPRLSFEHDHFIWSPVRPASAVMSKKARRVIRSRVRRNPAELVHENGLLSYLKGKDTSGMTTEEKTKQAAVGAGVGLAARGAAKALTKKTAAKVGAKVAKKGASKLIPGVGQALMVVDAAPEALAVARESRAHKKRTWKEVKKAKGIGGKLMAFGKGKAREVAHTVGGVGRIGAAAFVGSDVVKMGREAAQEKMMPKENGIGSLVFRKAAGTGVKRAVTRGVAKAAASPKSLRALQGAAKLAPKYTKAASSLLSEAGKIVGLGAAAVGAGALAVKGAAAHVKGPTQQQEASANPASLKANVAEINKLLKTMPASWQRQLASSRMKLRAAGADASQIPPERPNAHNVLLALNLNNRGEVSSEAAAGQEPTEGNPVPADVREAAMEGIRESHANDYGGYDFIGVARAIQLAISPKISDAALNRMRMYFDRKTKQDRLSDQYVQKSGKRYWSWLNWGGDPGARWSGSSRFAELVKSNPVAKTNTNTDPTVPGILLRTAPITSFMKSGSAFYPAFLYSTSKGQMLYPGDRPGYWKETPYIGASYENAAKEALNAALHSTGEVTVELVRLDLTRVPVSLDRLEQLSRNGQAERHAGDVPESVRKAVRTNPRLPVRQNFFFGGGAAKDTVTPEQRVAMIDGLGMTYVKGSWAIVRAPEKAGIFSSKLGPAYYLVPGITRRSLDDTSEYGMPQTYSAPAGAGFLKNAFQVFGKSTLDITPITLVDVYTKQTRDFKSIAQYNEAAAAVNYDWSTLMAKTNRGRRNPGEALTALQIQQRFTADFFDGRRQGMGIHAATVYAAQKNGVTLATEAAAAPARPKATAPKAAPHGPAGEVKGGIRERREGGGCPVCGRPMESYQIKEKVPKGRWVHKECAPAEAMTVQMNQQSAEESARTGTWFKLPLSEAAQSLLAEPPLANIERVPGGTFSQRDIVRLLARPDQRGFNVVKRMFEKMLERQTEGEKVAGRTRVLNLVGFNQPDAKRAKDLLIELDQDGYSPFLHFRMSTMLLNYVNTQLPQIMNKERKEGADFSLRTNPTMAAFIAQGKGLRVRDLIPPTVKPAATKKGEKKSKKNPVKQPAKHLLQQALNQEYATTFDPDEKRLVFKLRDAGLVTILASNRSFTRFAATQRARASRAPWQDFDDYDLVPTKSERRALALKKNPVPGITMEEWFADVQNSDWANWDLDRAGIMHYSGRGIPTYTSIVKK